MFNNYIREGLIRYIIIINIIIIMIIIHYYYSSVFLFRDQTETRQWISHWEEALVAIVDTQCCWKLGDMAELQPSL